jgi:uncharacterized YigZ family protein
LERIIIKDGTGEIVEKKSRFIANVKAVKSEEEAIAFINEIKKKYWDARHNCMAYVVDGIQRFSDDGEPSGTAGKPILDVITGRELTNAVIVVTRYFGGVLLGTGGLVRAYQKASIEALEDAVIAEKKQGKEFSIITDYTGLGKIQYIAANEKVNIMDTLYTDNVNIIIVCDSKKYEAFTKKVIEVTAGKVNITKAEDVVFYETKTCIQIVD